MIKILTIVGARPQFIKAAVVSKQLRIRCINEEIIHTGQHYDYNLSTIFWEELNIPQPTINLNVGSSRHGEQTGLMIQKIEEYIFLMNHKPNALMVYGDTNSTLAGAIVASKIHIPIIHIEAGLRSFNRNMPEEINRILTDHISELLFCSSEVGVNQLKKENIHGTIFNVGDVMYDAFLTFSEISKKKSAGKEFLKQLDNEFYLATIHRPSNTDNPRNLSSIIRAFSELGKQVIWPLHPRNKNKLSEYELPSNLLVIPPQSYFDMNALLRNCKKVLTDSGGLQKEAYWAKKPCITIREETEWIETLHGNWNQLTGPNSSKIISAMSQNPYTKWTPLYGIGESSIAIAENILNTFTSHNNF